MRRRILILLLLPLASNVLAQIDDRGYPIAQPGAAANNFTFDKPKVLTPEAEIPAVAERDEGPSIEVSEFQFDNIPEFPERGITRQSVLNLAESLRQQYSQKKNELASGYTEAELRAIAELLPSDEINVYSLSELEQVADYILSVSESDSLGGLRKYEVQGLVDILVGQRQAKGINDHAAVESINSLVLDDLVGLVVRQRAERGINFYELEDIAAQISAFYRSKGLFLAKAYIPVQSVKDGIVRFDILTGVLSGVTLQGNKDYSAEQLTKPFSQYVGKAANNDDIEEALYLINDFPGLMVQGALTAGDSVGETTLDLAVAEEKAWQATITADNHGAVFTGDNRVLAMVDFFNPLGYGDQLTVGYLQSWSPLNSAVAVFQYRAPVFDERTYAYVSADVNEFTVDGAGDQNIDDLNIEGTNTNFTVGMDRQFKRLPSLSFNAGFALTEKETEIEADQDLPNAGEKVQGAQLNFSFNNINKRYALMNIAMASIQYGDFKSGVDENLNQDDEFYKFALDWSTLKIVDLPFTSYQSYILARSKLRYSESGLPAFEQLPLGGADAVRAFVVSDYSADQAAYLAAEWYVELPMTWLSKTIEDKMKVALFVDGAYGSTNVELEGVSDTWANLAGAGVLFKFTWKEMLGTKISFSKPVTSKSNQDDFGADADSIQTYIEVTFMYD